MRHNSAAFSSACYPKHSDLSAIRASRSIANFQKSRNFFNRQQCRWRMIRLEPSILKSFMRNSDSVFIFNKLVLKAGKPFGNARFFRLPTLRALQQSESLEMGKKISFLCAVKTILLQRSLLYEEILEMSKNVLWTSSKFCLQATKGEAKSKTFSVWVLFAFASSSRSANVWSRESRNLTN